MTEEMEFEFQNSDDNEEPVNNSLDLSQNSNYSITDFRYCENLAKSDKTYVVKCQELESKYILVLKVIRRNDAETEYDKMLIDREIAIHSSLRHPNIVELINYFNDSQRVCLMLEFCNGGNLYYVTNEFGPLNNIIAATYVQQLTSALNYMHSKNIMHRDIKTSNIVLKLDGAIKLCDFGSAAFFNEQIERVTYVGTPDYLSPEVISSIPYTYTVDIWGIGVVLYEMLVGKPPFYRDTIEETELAIKNVDYNIPDYVNEKAASLIRKLCVKEAKDRCSLADILNDAYLKEFSEGQETCCDAAREIAQKSRLKRKIKIK